MNAINDANVHAPFKIHSLSAAIALTLCTSAGQTWAQQEDPEVEEVLVTGSYIQNSAFAQNSPVDTVTAQDIEDSGAPSMDQYIRDMTYTQNTDAVNNVLGGDVGPQSSEGASFNLRGLGENSTLTLVDGVRTVNDNMNALMPDIAIDRMELVLDGGSALYGSDAVAGVVNMIPMTQFEGLRFSSRYQQPTDGVNEEMNISGLAGTSLDNGVNLVGAIEFRKRTDLAQHERQREWMFDDGSSASGNPGAYRQVNGATPDLRGGRHGGTHADHSMVDPSCGTFNPGGPNPTMQERTEKFAVPSGVLQGEGTDNPFCRYQYTNPYAYRLPLEEVNAYANATWDATDRLQLELRGNYYLQDITDAQDGSTTTAMNPNNRQALVVPADHPANPWGVDVTPWLLRPLTGQVGPQPDWLEGHFDNNGKGFDQNGTWRWQVGADYDLPGSWRVTGYYTKQESWDENLDPDNWQSLSRTQQALVGEGGPNRDQYWNPFASSDPRSPHHVPGVTDNTAELIDWMFMPEMRRPRITSRERLEVAEGVASGDVYDLPAGPLSMAAGLQRREIEDINFEHPLEQINDQYGRDITNPPAENTHFFSDVNAAFLELQAPIIAGLGAQLAVRHERFTTFNLESTTPKVALRWEATPAIALRASWGESFLAPTPFQARPVVPDEFCGEAFSGQDPFTGRPLVAQGAQQCQAGNPDLDPETSTITNLGFTWEPGAELTGLSVSLDYQEVEYEDRIRTISEDDAVFEQFDTFLQQQGITAEQYDPTPGSASRQAAEQFLRERGLDTPPITRDPQSFDINTVFTQARNISAVFVELLDLSSSYTLNTQNFGTFSPEVSASYYTDYSFQGLSGERQEALGNQNHLTSIVPPIPKLKAQLKLDWLQGPHNASVTANYRHHVLYDGRSRDNYNDGLIATVDSHIDRETITNARYSYTFDNLFDSRIRLSAGINNIADIRPERLPIQGGFESRLSVPWGREIWMSVNWQPGF